MAEQKKGLTNIKIAELILKIMQLLEEEGVSEDEKSAVIYKAYRAFVQTGAIY